MAALVPDAFYDYEHFTLDRLVRIVPVAQTRTLDLETFTLLSLECYQDGFIILSLTESIEQYTRPLPDPDDWEPPLILQSMLVTTDITDDAGSTYNARTRSGSGGGSRDRRYVTHNAYCVAPALATDASVLTLTLERVTQPRYSRSGKPAWPRDAIVSGPSTMTFDLTGPAEGVQS